MKTSNDDLLNEKRLHLKCYTLAAAEVIQKAIVAAEATFPLPLNFLGGGHILAIDSYFVDVDDVGELYLKMNPKYGFTFDDMFTVMKNFYEMKKIGYKLAECRDQHGKLIYERDELFEIIAAIIKHWANEQLTDTEKDIVGHPLTPFEQIKLRTLFSAFDESRSYYERLNVCERIRSFIENAQKY